MMRDFANWALDTAKVRGATYADVRVMDIRLRYLSTKNGQVGTLAESESCGIGIRVIAQGSWGFASTDRLTREGIAACAAEAVAIAKASALAKKHDVQMVPVDAYQDTWQNPYVKDPFQIPIERQLDLLLKTDREMTRVKGVTLAETSMAFRRIEQFFASSLGSAIHQIKMQSGAGIVATAFAGNEIQRRSYPNSFGGQHMLPATNWWNRSTSWATPCALQKKPSRCIRRSNRPRARKRLFSTARSWACKFMNPSDIRLSWTACWARKPISRA